MKYWDLSRQSQMKAIARFMDEDVDGRDANQVHDILLNSDLEFNQYGIEIDEDESHKLEFI
jgi:hypothetical protein